MILVFGCFPYFWDLSLKLIEWFGFTENNSTIRAMAFLIGSQLIETILKQPFSLYSTFVIEKEFGFNRQTIGLYVKDELKGFALFVAISLPILSILLWVIDLGGKNFWICNFFFIFLFLFFYFLNYFFFFFFSCFPKMFGSLLL